MKRLALLMTVAAVVAVCAGGCDCQRKLESVQIQNRKLTQRVAKLEDQLEQAKVIIFASATDTQASTSEPVYIIVEGDSLWGIAKKQLGSGTRHKEILALNPQIKKDEPLTIGTKLKMPPK